MGTTISKQLVELMGGEIALESVEGKGSTFRFTVLMRRPSQTCKIKAEADLKSIPILLLTSAGRKGDSRQCKEIGIDGYLTKPIQQSELRRAIQTILGFYGEEKLTEARLVTRHTLLEEHRKDIRILLAEDYPTNQQIAIRHLESAGYQVDLAENGKLVVEAFKRGGHDLILMDVQMPEMDGYQATEAIRKLEEPENTRIPIIAMTAHAMQGYKEKCLATGMDDFITKPLKRKELLAMVGNWAFSGDDRKTGEPCPGTDHVGDTPPLMIGPQLQADSPLDFQKAVDEFGRGKDFLFQVIDGFLTNAGAQMEVIRKALFDDDADAVMREAHSIKGGQPILHMKILIADDEITSRLKTDQLIKSLGYETPIAQNGMQALDIWRQVRPRVVITDWMMP